MKAKGKVKSFVKKHEKAISKTTLILSGLGIGFVVGKKVTSDRIWRTAIDRVDKALPEVWTGNDIIDKFIVECQEAYPNTFNLITVNACDMKPEDLGKLGEKIIDLGEKDFTFTEFLCLGPAVKK